MAEVETTTSAGPAAGTPQPDRPRVVAAAVERSRRAGVIRTLNRVVEHGGSAVMITAEGGERPSELAAAVEVIDLQSGERRLGLNRLITRDPMRLVRRVRGLPVQGPSPAWARVSASKPYRMIRPWLLWRVLRRNLNRLRVGEIDQVVIVHPNSWPIAWQLHRRNPAISIAYDVPDAVWARAGRPVPPPPPPAPEAPADAC